MGKELWTESVKRNSSGYLETVSLFFNLKINTSLNTKKKKKALTLLKRTYLIYNNYNEQKVNIVTI